MGWAYYNENDANAAAWLRELMKKGLIPDGDVDDSDIRDVHPSDIKHFTQCHFFAGIGGWPEALRLAQWPTDRPVWTGSCPCQPFSDAGKRKAQADERHLWPEWFRLIRECRPSIVFGEQVAGAVKLGWIDGVCFDMEAEGYAVGTAVLPAGSVDAPHKRDRLWFAARAMADTYQPCASEGREQRSGQQPGPGHNSQAGFWADAEYLTGPDRKARRAKPGIRLLAHGIPGRVAKLRGLGNAIVPQVAAQIIRCFV